MKNQSMVVVGSRMNVFSFLGLIFVTLKLTKAISWSWWLVTSPFWAVPALVTVAAAIAIILILIFAAVAKLIK